MTEGSRGTVAIWLVAAVIATVAVLRLTDSGGGGGAAVRVDRSAGDSGGAGRADAGAARGIYVHVAGAVRRPGLVTLPSGSRVALAVERAGGLLRKADLSGVNLAARLEDGQQVLVPVRGAAVARRRHGTGAHPARPGRRSSAWGPRPSTSSTRSTASAHAGRADPRVPHRARRLSLAGGAAGGGRDRREALRDAQRRAAAVSLLRNRPWARACMAALACGLALAESGPVPALATGAVLAAALLPRCVRRASARSRAAVSSGRRGGRGAAARRAGRSRAADPGRRTRRSARPPADAAPTGRLRLVRRGSGGGGPAARRAAAGPRRALVAAAALTWRSATSSGWRRRLATAVAEPRGTDSTSRHTCAGAASRPSCCWTARGRPAAPRRARRRDSTACASGPSAPWPPACPPTKRRCCAAWCSARTS